MKAHSLLLVFYYLKILFRNEFLKTYFSPSTKQVYKAREVKTNRIYAIKTCEKSHIRQENMRNAIMKEKEVLTIITNHSSPFLIRLYCCFQDSIRLCMCSFFFHFN